jgi:hypothetical protein
LIENGGRVSTEQQADSPRLGSALPVAGWYADPADPSMLRYWDGTAWSPHVAPAFSKSPSTVSSVPAQGGLAATPPLDGYAITSLILGILGGVLLSVCFGIAALRRIGRGTRRGKGLAVTGLALSMVWVVVVVATIAYQDGRAPVHAPDGTVTRAGQVLLRDLQVGDCIEVPRDLTGLTTTSDVPCSQPHNGQVFTVLQADATSFQGETRLQDGALTDCKRAVPSFLGSSQTLLHVVALFPNQRGWDLGDRGEICVLVDRQKEITGDIRSDG